MHAHQQQRHYQMEHSEGKVHTLNRHKPRALFTQTLELHVIESEALQFLTAQSVSMIHDRIEFTRKSTA